MNNSEIFKSLKPVGIVSLIIFPAMLIASFILHHFGEYTLADLTTIKFSYIPPTPERFLELFSSKSIMDFILPHLIIYLAIPLGIPAIAFLGSLLFPKKPRLAISGIFLSLFGMIFMGGVFGSWLSFVALGNVSTNNIPILLDVIEKLTEMQGMLLLTSALAGFSLLGFMIIAGGLFITRDIPRWQSGFIFAGNLMILAFMDIDNLMLVGSILWFIGVLPFLMSQKTVLRS